MRELCSEGALSGGCFRYNDEGGGNDVVGDEAAPIVWSAEVAGDANVVPACVSEADYLIGLANLKGHSYGPVSYTHRDVYKRQEYPFARG